MIKCNRKNKFVNLRRSLGLILTIMLLAGSLEVTFMPVEAYASTTVRQGNKIVITTTSESLIFDGYSHESTVYAGEIKRNGETVLNYLFSEDISRSSVNFDNLRSALPNPYSDMVPSVVAEQTQKGLKEMSAATVNGINLGNITSDWKDAENIAAQIYRGKNTSDSTNKLMYDASAECRSRIDDLARDRENLDNPVPTNKRVISHLGTKTTDNVHGGVIDGETVEIHDVNLIYLSEATTLIYTSVNVVDRSDPDEKKEDPGSKKDQKKKSGKHDSEEHKTASWILNPNEKQQLVISYTGAPSYLAAGYQEQGAAANELFGAAVPSGWIRAFSFNVLDQKRQPDLSVKNGTMVLNIPGDYIKAGRQFALLGMNKGGQVITYADTDLNPNTVTVNLTNMNGYAFFLICTN